MPSILDELRERVKHTESSLQQAKEATAKAQAKQTALEEEFEAYSSALRFEERRNGVSNAGKTVSVSLPSAKALSDNGEHGSANKSDQLRQLLRERKEGITPTDLHAELQRRRVDIGSNYVYSLLFKLKASGLVRKKGRKFFWVEPQETKTAGE